MAGGVVCVISANAEWRAILKLLRPPVCETTPFGQMFQHTTQHGGRAFSLRFVQGGWGKISAAASAQYILDHFQPDVLLNLGTCGGFAGLIAKGTVLVVDRALVYDIYELMGDPAEHVQFYTTPIDLGWLGAAPLPPGCQRGLIVSADRDLAVDQIADLHARYGANAGDWESGAIAWVCARSQTRLLILRAVSDLVGPDGDETYGNLPQFETAAEDAFTRLVGDLGYWLDRCY